MSNYQYQSIDNSNSSQETTNETHNSSQTLMSLDIMINYISTVENVLFCAFMIDVLNDYVQTKYNDITFTTFVISYFVINYILIGILLINLSKKNDEISKFLNENYITIKDANNIETKIDLNFIFNVITIGLIIYFLIYVKMKTTDFGLCTFLIFKIINSFLQVIKKYYKKGSLLPTNIISI